MAMAVRRSAVTVPRPLWVPCEDEWIAEALDLAACAAGDRVVDLGCGDGRVLEAHRDGAAAGDGPRVGLLVGR
jgi:hypothetical protein